MDISVCICTWNRAILLNQTLKSLGKIQIPQSLNWELLIVNNNSTDYTGDVIAQQKKHLPIREIFEKKQGKSHALNRAISEVEGDFIIWIDDDVIVESNWLHSYLDAFCKWPKVTIFGGPIDPWFEGSPPTWLLKSISHSYLAGAYGLLDYGEAPIFFSKNNVPNGANMATRTKDQLKYLFNTNLGPPPINVLRGEDTELVQRMISDGLQGVWVPDARVKHYIPKYKQKKSYVRKYYFMYGNYLNIGEKLRCKAQLFGKPTWLWKKALLHEAKYQTKKYFRSSVYWIDDLIFASINWGKLSK